MRRVASPQATAGCLLATTRRGGCHPKDPSGEMTSSSPCKETALTSGEVLTGHSLIVLLSTLYDPSSHLGYSHIKTSIS